MISVYHRQPDGTYLHVADVMTPDPRPTRLLPTVEEELEWAFEQTNNIDQEWRLNLWVTMKTEGQHRSSMVGDLFVVAERGSFLVAPWGFTPVGEAADPG